MCCVFRDAILLSIVVKSAYMSYSMSNFTDSTNNSVLTERTVALCHLNSRDCYAWHSQEISNFWNTQSSPPGIYIQAMVNDTILSRSDVWSEF